MKVIIALGHPAHYHLFSKFIDRFVQDGNKIKIVITDKDILKKLLKENGFEYEVIADRQKNESLLDKGLKIFRSSIRLRRIVKEYNPDLVIGGLSQIAYATLFTRSKSLFIGEDDITYTLLQGIITYPLVSGIIAPDITNVGIFRYKKISYNGYQKLAYLHPNVFTPDTKLISSIDLTKPYFLIRLVSLKAYHDMKGGGFTEPVLDLLINKLKHYGNVYISSENDLDNKYKEYIAPVKAKNIHHFIAFAKIYFGDSQSMAVEAAMLGTPSIRFNNFAGRISVLEELEHKYGLTFGIKSTDPVGLFNKTDELLKMENLRCVFHQRRDHMLTEKIDVSAFLVWLIENFPDSFNKASENPGFIFDKK